MQAKHRLCNSRNSAFSPCARNKQDNVIQLAVIYNYRNIFLYQSTVSLLKHLFWYFYHLNWLLVLVPLVVLNVNVITINNQSVEIYLAPLVTPVSICGSGCYDLQNHSRVWIRDSLSGVSYKVNSSLWSTNTNIGHGYNSTQTEYQTKYLKSSIGGTRDTVYVCLCMCLYIIHIQTHNNLKGKKIKSYWFKLYIFLIQELY